MCRVWTKECEKMWERANERKKWKRAKTSSQVHLCKLKGTHSVRLRCHILVLVAQEAATVSLTAPLLRVRTIYVTILSHELLCRV